jgi:CII-binding regulator of phage lambda lysogenization HflD
MISKNVHAYMSIAAASIRYTTVKQKIMLIFLRKFYIYVHLEADRSEEASKAIAAKRELATRVNQISKDYEEEQSRMYEITQDMTRQYKGMQEELLGRINKLEETVQELNDRLADSDVRMERTLKEKNTIIQMKDDEIAELRSKMDDMAEEFGEMLRETLDKMRERIEVTSGNFEAPELPIQRRMEEMKLSSEND